MHDAFAIVTGIALVGLMIWCISMTAQVVRLLSLREVIASLVVAAILIVSASLGLAIAP